VKKYARWLKGFEDWSLEGHESATLQPAHAVLVEKGVVKVFECSEENDAAEPIATYSSLFDKELIPG